MNYIVPIIIIIAFGLITPKLNGQIIKLDVSKDRFSSIRTVINRGEISNNSLSYFIDSLLTSDSSHLRMLIDYAYPIKFDSIYDNHIYELANELRNTEDAIIQGQIAQELIDLQYDALLPFTKETNGSLSYGFWRSFILTSVLGYDLAFYLEPIPRGISGLAMNSGKVNLNKSINHKESLKIILFEWVESIKDVSQHQQLFKNIALEDLKKGSLNPFYKYFVSRLIAHNIRTRDELLLADYSIILDSVHQDMRLWLLNLFGTESGNEYYPNIMLDILKKGQPNEIVEVLRWTSNCWDKSKREQVHDAVLNLFFNSTDYVKFQSCFVLMHDFRDPIAIDYLLDVIKRGSKKERITAIYWVGDACNFGEEMPDTTYNILFPLLQHEDINIQRATVEAFMTYVGDRVVESLIPFLNFELTFIAEQIERKLLNYHDKQLVLSKLRGYRNDENVELMSKVKKLVIKIETK